jgi:O-antigen ligase
VEAFNLLGHGTGSASLGLQYISLLDPRAKIPPPAVEGGYAAVLWEWGVVGLVVWLWWTIRLLQKLWVATTKVAGSPYHMYGFSALLYTFFILFAWFFLGLQPYQNYITQAYLWFLAGLAFKLPQLARTQAESVARPRGRTAKRGERGPYER